MSGFVLLVISVAMGFALAFYPSWRLIAIINSVFFVVAVSAKVAAGESVLFAALYALLYLIVVSACFVASSLLLDAVNDRKADQDAALADRHRFAWDGKSWGSKNSRQPGEANNPDS